MYIWMILVRTGGLLTSIGKWMAKSLPLQNLRMFVKNFLHHQCNPAIKSYQEIICGFGAVMHTPRNQKFGVPSGLRCHYWKSILNKLSQKLIKMIQVQKRFHSKWCSAQIYWSMLLSQFPRSYHSIVPFCLVSKLHTGSSLDHVNSFSLYIIQWLHIRVCVCVWKVKEVKL